MRSRSMRPPKTLYNRWKRWSAKGVFARMVDGLAPEAAVSKTVMNDATFLHGRTLPKSGGGSGAQAKVTGRGSVGATSRLSTAHDRLNCVCSDNPAAGLLNPRAIFAVGEVPAHPSAGSQGGMIGQLLRPPYRWADCTLGQGDARGHDRPSAKMPPIMSLTMRNCREVSPARQYRMIGDVARVSGIGRKCTSARI